MVIEVDLDSWSDAWREMSLDRVDVTLSHSAVTCGPPLKVD